MPVLSVMEDKFENKTFLRHQAQGFEQLPLVNSYKTEEESFLKTVKIVPKKSVPHGANVISSHTINKVKKNDDGSLKLKARVAPHGNEDNLKDILNKDCSTCRHTGLRMVKSIESINGWTI